MSTWRVTRHKNRGIASSEARNVANANALSKLFWKLGLLLFLRAAAVRVKPNFESITDKNSPELHPHFSLANRASCCEAERVAQAGCPREIERNAGFDGTRAVAVHGEGFVVGGCWATNDWAVTAIFSMS